MLGGRLQIDHLRRVEATWNFSEDQLLAELQRISQEGLIYDDGGYWRSSPEGKAQREKRWQEKCLRHPALLQQTANLNDLILALVVSAHGESDFFAGDALRQDSLPIYLWKSSEDSINESLHSLIEKKLIHSFEFRIGEARLVLTADGRIEYAKGVVARLGLVPPSTILAPLETPTPAFSGIGLLPAHADNLAYRWEEAERCVAARAWLAATILYGSILESILLAVLTNNKEAALRSPKAPKDRKTGEVPSIEQWRLETMLNVAGDLEFVDSALLKHGHALRDSRNLIHPWKQIQDRSRPDGNLVQISKLVVDSLICRIAVDAKQVCRIMEE